MTAWFGALEGRSLELSRGLNILYAPNESGKSTWCAFLRTMLYGLDTSQRARAGQKPDKLKYRPWSGAPMSGSLEAETANGPVTVRRWTERENQPMQAFSATVTGTETPAWGITAETAGETLTGMPRAVFERSVFIRQAGMEMENDPELDRRISAIVSSGDEEVSFLEAEKRLRAWQRRRRSGKRGRIPELQEAMEENRRRLQEIRERTCSIAEAEEEIAGLERQRLDREKRMMDARNEQRRRALSDMGEARQAVGRAEQTRRAAAEESGRAAEDLAESPFGALEPEAAAQKAGADQSRAEELYAAAAGMPSPGRAAWLLLPAVLAAVLAFLLPWRIPLLAAGAALFVLAGARYAHLRRGREAGERMLEERSALLSEYGAARPEEIPALLEEYRALWEASRQADARLAAAEQALAAARTHQKETEARAMNDLDFQNGDNEAVRQSREAERLRDRIGALKERRAREEGQLRSLEDPLVLETELAEQERQYADLLRQEEALQLALETLTRADGELQERLSPRLAKKAAEYFSFLTDGRYDELTLTRDLSAHARRAGDAVGWDADYLSAGARDQLYLALRLALCDLALPGEEICPIVLDDALVTFDGERMARALELMRRIAEERQVLLFTCHRREGAYFAGDEAVNLVDLTEERNDDETDGE